VDISTELAAYCISSVAGRLKDISLQTYKQKHMACRLYNIIPGWQVKRYLAGRHINRSICLADYTI
jgi:hypothetical protein